ncbi:hypothetical protein [Phenylobacterium sp.]|uniref:hypothetical protein n=1 Tax=Phenylobacterium sp. TaxID=1871053 RepID=UPI00271DCCDC|nr:hypothetical protein [Phenylobacterium sp.]MDO8380097.1 hypothetical protein [Phenylobacterium sp.]
MNPEFQRNLWLEASPRRVAWAAVTLILIYGATALLARDAGGGPLPALAGVGGFVFLICGVIWGSRAAGTAVLAEIADRTWDFQRLSALTPWAMTWGKLLGSASLAWLCALTGVVLMAGLMVVQGQPGALWMPAFLISLALLLQAVSLGAALIGVRKARAEGRVARPGGVMGGLILGLFLLSVVAGSSGFQKGAGLAGIPAFLYARGDVTWWGQVFPAVGFRTLATLAFAGWALTGAWRLMRLELQMKNAPVVWPAFLIFLAVFLGGFAYAGGGLAAALLVGALAVALAAYAGAFAEPADRVRLRQFAGALGKGDLARALPLTPAAIAPFLLALILVAAAFGIGGAGSAFDQGPDPAQAAALLAFILRDLGVIALFRFGPRPQRGDFGAVVALALLYAVGGIVGGVISPGTGQALFVPLSIAPWASLASGLAQAVVAWALAWRRIKAPEVR